MIPSYNYTICSQVAGAFRPFPGAETDQLEDDTVAPDQPSAAAGADAVASSPAGAAFRPPRRMTMIN